MYRLLLFLPLLGLLACGSTKGTTTSAVPASKAAASKGYVELSSREKAQFDYHYFEGINQRMQGNYSRSAAEFEQALKIYDQSGAAHYERAYSLYQTELSVQLDQAEASAKRATQLEPKNEWYQKLLARIYTSRGEIEKAAGVFETLVRINPKNPNLYEGLATLYLQEKQYKQAINTYSRMQSKFGVNSATTLPKARVYVQTQDYDNAAKELTQLIANDEDNKAYYQILLAAVYLQKQQLDKAEEVYKSILAGDPNNGEAALSLAKLYYVKDEDDKGIVQMREAMRLQSIDVDNKIQLIYGTYLSGAQLDSAQAPEAIELTKIIVDAHPREAAALALLGDLYYNSDQLDSAAYAYKRSTALQSDVYAVWRQLMLIGSRQLDYAALQETSAKAIELFPSQPVSYFFNGLALSQLKEHEKAVETYELGLQYLVDNEALEAQFYVSLADALHALQKHEESDKYFNKSLRLQPNNATALNNFAYYLAVRGEQLDKAEKMSKQSLKLEKNNSSFLDTYGYILYLRGKYAEAEDYYRQSLAAEEGSAEVLHHLGDALFKQGKEEEAVKYWKLAREAGGGAELDEKIANRKL